MKAIVPVQIKAARALLEWPREMLAARCSVSTRTLADVENGEGNPKLETLAVIRATLEAAGIAFIDEDGAGGPGVCFRKPKSGRVA
jgi:DNA-binding XRE family transcriptional regulator